MLLFVCRQQTTRDDQALAQTGSTNPLRRLLTFAPDLLALLPAGSSNMCFVDREITRCLREAYSPRVTGGMPRCRPQST